MISSFLIAAAAWVQAATASPNLEMWRLDCGKIDVSDFGVFSDAYLYEGQPKSLTASCYLIRHGEEYLLWDTGVAGPAKEWVFTITLDRRITEQLEEIGVAPEEITYVGISHFHDDHTGQASDFPSATLLMGSGDWEFAQGNEGMRERFAPWISGGAKVTPVQEDRDIFGDGSVMMLHTPGHTPGHKVLLVRLASGPVLLSGDLYHATEQVANRGVPTFNTDRADTLASFERFQAIAKSLGAKVILQHERNDIDKLPAFPNSAK